MATTPGMEYLSELPARLAPEPKPARKLHSVFGLQRERGIKGSFETAVSSYSFEYLPTKASLADGRLQLQGTLSLTSGRGIRRNIGNVSALLISSQSGVAGVPAAIVARAPRPQPDSLPVTEATDALGFAGALFFKLSPISASQSGVRIDMRQVQLNCRLAPVSEIERRLQILLTDIVAATQSAQPDLQKADSLMTQLNEIFSAK